MDRLFTERWIHQYHVISPLAKFHESEASHRIFCEESSLQPMAVLGFLGVLAKCLNYPRFSLLEELIVA